MGSIPRNVQNLCIRLLVQATPNRACRSAAAGYRGNDDASIKGLNIQNCRELLRKYAALDHHRLQLYTDDRTNQPKCCVEEYTLGTQTLQK